jgi:flagellar basal body P-ring protein FlgI
MLNARVGGQGLSRLGVAIAAFIAIATLSLATGCNRELLSFGGSDEKVPRMIGSVAGHYGLEPLEVLGYGIVTGLQGHGGNIPPGPARTAALQQMTQQKVDKPAEYLATKDAAVVIVRGKIPPGARQGDSFDIDVQCLDEDKQTTNLRGGFLLMCGLRDVADVSQLSKYSQDAGPNFRTGNEWGIANGPVVVGLGSGAESRRGRVMGGGKAKKERQLALLIRNDFALKGADTAARVGNAIDDRYRVQPSGNFLRIADAKRPDYIALRVPDQYRHNLPRFLAVIDRIPFEAGGAERILWQRQCAEDLLDPEKCFEAAVCLEALGAESRETLLKAKGHTSVKVRFAAAEAMAYLGQSEMADVLAEIARTTPELRPYALTALSVVDDSTCTSRLRELLACESVEVRCGAFAALRTAYPSDRALNPLPTQDAGFTMYQVAPQSPRLVHITSSGRPEVVLFGESIQLVPPFSLSAGPDLIVTAQEGETECTITLLSGVDTKTEKQRCSLNLSDLIQRCTAMGGSYPDVVDLLRQAADGHNLDAKFVVDGLPRIIPWSQLAKAELPVQ